MHFTIKALVVAALAAAPLHAQAGCERLDAAAVTRVIQSQRLATERGQFVDDGNGICRVTFGGEAGPTQVTISRIELHDAALVRETMQAGRGDGRSARPLSGVGDEAFVARFPSGDGANVDIRDGTAFVSVQVLTQRGTAQAQTAAAADIARLLFGGAAKEPAPARAVAEARPSRREPEPYAPGTASSADRAAVADDDADEPPEGDARTPIAIPEFAEGPGDACEALPPRAVRDALAAAGLTPGAAATVKAPGLCVYTFGEAMTDAAVRVTVQYAGARETAVAAALVASMRRRRAAQPLAGVGDEAAILAGSGNAVIAYRAGLTSGFVEVLAPAASPTAVRSGAERVARTWARRLAASSRQTNGDAR